MGFDVYVISAAKVTRLAIIFVKYVDVMLIEASSTSKYVESQIREHFEESIFP